GPSGPGSCARRSKTGRGRPASPSETRELLGLSPQHGVSAPPEPSFTDADHPIFGGPPDLRPKLRRRLGESRGVVGQAEQVLEHQYLAVAGRPRADTDHRDADRLEDARGYLVRHRLDQEQN